MSETIERFTVYKVVAGRAHWKGDPDGMWVLFEDAQRDLAALQAENERLKAERDDYKAGMEFFEDQQEARMRVVGRCAECGKDINADGSRTVENREDSPEWHSWCYGSIQKARVTLLEDAIREWKKAKEALRAAANDDEDILIPASMLDASLVVTGAEAVLLALVDDPPTLQGDE